MYYTDIVNKYRITLVEDHLQQSPGRGNPPQTDPRFILGRQLLYTGWATFWTLML